MIDPDAADMVVLDPLATPDWNEQVKAFPESTIFHSANWAALLAEAYGYRPTFFALVEGGALRACLPMVEVRNRLTGPRGVSVSFADFCGALAGGSAFPRLLAAAAAYGREKGWRYLELRGEPHLSGEVSASAYLHHEVPLVADEAAARARLRESTARNIRKAVREGVTVEFTTSPEGVREFYRLHCLTRRRHGVPPQPSRFFALLQQHILAKGLGFAALARYRGEAVAGTVCIGFGSRALYKYGASDERFQQLRANNLLLWEAMRRCAAEGYRCFSLGRTELDNEGLLVFKNGWGATPTLLNYYRYDIAAGGFSAAGQKDHLRLVRRALRHMPASLLRGIGALLYRYAG